MYQDKTIVSVMIPENNLKVELTERVRIFSPDKVYRVSLETDDVVEKYSFQHLEKAINKFDEVINQYKKGLIG